MTTTDKLTAIERLRLHIDEDFSVPDLSDLLEEIEALEAAHRRASQAAPAPSDALQEIDADLVEQAISDRTSDGATQRQIAEYVVECIRAALSTPTEERQ